MKDDSLYALSEQLARINDEIISEEGVISEALEVKLDELLPKIQDKASSLSRWLKNIDGKTLAFDSELDRLQKRKQAMVNLKERLKTYLKQSMEVAGMTKIEAGVFTVAIQTNPPAVEIIDKNLIPSRYEDVIPEQYVVSKARLKDDLMAGKEIPGAVLRRGTHIRIR